MTDDNIVVEVVEQALTITDEDGDPFAHVLFVHTVKPSKRKKNGLDVQSAVYLVENGGQADDGFQASS